MANRKKNSKGSVMLEFGVVMGVLIPLLFGTVAFGINLGNMLQSTQISRDIGYMYARGVDFSTATNQSIAVNLVQGLGGMTANGGQGVIILSQVRKIYDTDCTAAGLTTGACTNLNQRVFSNRIVIGNSGLKTSNFGTPSGACAPTANGNISSNTYLTQAACQTTGFTGATISQAQGDVAYVVEAYFATPDLSFLSLSGGGGGTGTAGSYTRAIF